MNLTAGIELLGRSLKVELTTLQERVGIMFTYVADFLGAANLLDIVATERVRGGASALSLGDVSLRPPTRSRRRRARRPRP